MKIIHLVGINEGSPPTFCDIVGYHKHREKKTGMKRGFVAILYLYGSIYTTNICMFRPHRMHSTDAAYCYTRCGVVCLCVSVCLYMYVMRMSHAKWLNRSKCCLARVGPHNHVLDGSHDWSPREATILGMGIHGHASACGQSVYSTRRCGLLSNYFDLLLVIVQ